MKKQLPFLITFFVVLIFMIFVAPVLNPVSADGSYSTDLYPYSITIVGNNTYIYIVQSSNPIFVDSIKNVWIKGSFKTIYLNGSGVNNFDYTGTVNYSNPFTYDKILESSHDIFNLVTKQLIFQSEETDNVVISEQTIKTFYYLFGVLFGGIMSVTFSTSFKMGV